MDKRRPTPALSISKMDDRLRLQSVDLRERCFKSTKLRLDPQFDTIEGLEEGDLSSCFIPNCVMLE